MYNRYIPQSDGTYQRNRMPSPPQKQETSQHIPPPQPPRPEEPPCHQPESAGAFLRRLLPGNLDTGDLMVILLLLLMAGDCKDNKGSWMLTLVLYLFL